MAFTLDVSLALGTGQTGIADLRAQLVDTAGANVGSAVSTGFVEVGSGNYLWHYAAWPDEHRGGVKFYSAAVPDTVLAFVAINPEETQLPDVLENEHGSGPWGGGLGSGGFEWPYTLTAEGDGSPIADAQVWVTSDEAGETTIASGRTDENGVVTFFLNEGATVWVWRRKAGWNFENPDEEVVG